VIRAIAEAREHGDLSENAEYQAARERQSFIEGRVKELESILALAEVIDTSRLSGAVKFGAKVTLIDEDTEEEKSFQIVGEPEADLERGRLNVRSPLARALIGKDEGDQVEVRTPGGEKSYEIVRIEYS
jgi:transcription elongation factor GreA